MSKMSELSQVLNEMIACGEGMIKAANAIKEIFSSTEETPATPKAAPSYTKEDVRGILAAKLAAGFKKEISLLKISFRQYPEIFSAMHNLSDQQICGHVHDDLIFECPENTEVSSITSVMGKSPDWMPNILIRGDGYETDFYKKD